DGIGGYREGNRRLAWLQVRQQMVGRSFFALVQVFFSASPALIFLVAGYSHLSLGTVFAFTTLQTRLLFPIGNMLQTSVEVQSSLALFERIFQYLDLEHEIVDAPDAKPLTRAQVTGRVDLRHVWFHYEEDGPWALQDVSLTVQPGQLAALVGPSGAGKTTISYLIPRLYDVTRGRVELDGVDVREVEQASLADAIGMVTQETYLFHASVRDNLLYARPDATDGELEAAARAAQIHERITELEDRYDTLVGERGYRMSGGEKERLAIGRVS